MKYWFKRKRYGYGWTPVTWQGWAVVGAYALCLIGSSLYLTQTSSGDDPSTAALAGFFMIVFGSSLTVIVITRKHGPPGKWRWGKNPDDNPDEDW